MRTEHPVRSPSAIVARPVDRRAADHSSSRGRDRRAGAQPAAADRRDERVEAGNVLEQFQCRGAGACDHALVVERMDLDCSRLHQDVGQHPLAIVERRLAPRDRRPRGFHRRLFHRAGSPPASRRTRVCRGLPRRAPRQPRDSPRNVRQRRGAASSGDSDWTAFVAPRYLNAPPVWRCSAFTKTVAPIHASRSSDRNTGVRTTNGSIRAAAAATSITD